MIDKSEIVRRKSLATISKAEQLNKRANNILGASQQIDLQMEYLRNCITASIQEDKKWGQSWPIKLYHYDQKKLWSSRKIKIKILDENIQIILALLIYFARFSPDLRKYF